MYFDGYVWKCKRDWSIDGNWKKNKQFIHQDCIFILTVQVEDIEKVLFFIVSRELIWKIWLRQQKNEKKRKKQKKEEEN